MEDSNALKFLHFNNGNQKNLAKKQLKGAQSRTVAVLALSPHRIRKIVEQSITSSEEITIPMVIGVTKVSQADNYSKAIGRVQSVKNMKEIDVAVKSIQVNNTHITIYLASVQGVSLNLRLTKKTGFSGVFGYLHYEDADGK